MTDPSKYHLLITAGPSYDPSTHTIIPVNTTHTTPIHSPHLTASLTIRIQNYRGLPTPSPSSSPYFSHPSHKHDLYSIGFSFTPKEDINGADLVFGNDFAKPIRDHLPPGFSAALRVVKWAIDPGLDGDPYAEHPYLYGPLLSSINVLRVGEKGGEKKSGAAGEGGENGDEAEAVVLEGADGEEAEEIREEAGVPDDGAKRMKHFLNVEHRKQWTFEKGREYQCDFFNPYLDFNDLALKLPGVSLYLMRFWDGQPLRYVLKKKNAEVDQELFVIVFTLVPEEELEDVKRKWEGQVGEGGEGEGKGDGVRGSGEENEEEGKRREYEDEGVD